MPLSEQEQRLLEEMERSLYHNDADFVATVSSRTGKTNYRSLILGILVGILGVAVLFGGVVIRQPVVGVIGFGVMFVGVLVAAAPPRSSARDAGAAGSGPDPAPARSSSRFMDRLNERWERRQENRD